MLMKGYEQSKSYSRVISTDAKSSLYGGQDKHCNPKFTD